VRSARFVLFGSVAERLCREPRYGVLTDIEPPRQVCLCRRSGGKRLQLAVLLGRGELRRSANMNTALLCALAAFAGARADQFALELVRPSQHRVGPPPFATRRSFEPTLPGAGRVRMEGPKRQKRSAPKERARQRLAKQQPTNGPARRTGQENSF
jgi:hypothetical protein